MANYRHTVIANFGEDYIDVPSTHDFKYQCPHCKEIGKKTSDYKLFVNYNTLVFHCFRCGWKGKLSSEEYIEEGTANGFLKMLSSRIIAEAIDEDTEILFKIPNTIPTVTDPAVKYLESRGITYEDILKFNMRVSTLEDPSKFLGRIVIPNKLIAGKWTDMYSARTYCGFEPKYLNPKNSPRAKIVFNLHNIPDDCEQIIINEGVLTSIAAGYDSIATFGKSVTENQISQITAKRPKKIYVSLDNDAKPEEGINKDPTQYKVDELIAKLLRATDAEIYYVKMPPGKDAVDVGRDTYRNVYIKNAIRVRNIKEYQMYTLKT